MATAAKRKTPGATGNEEFARAAGRQERSKAPLTVSRPELLIGGSDREFRHLVHSLFGFLARHEKLRAGHAKMIGLAGIAYTALISIAHLAIEGDVSVKRLADHLHFSGAFITSTVGKLVALGLVHKKTDPLDRRRVTLTVSTKGYVLLEKLAPMQRKVNDVEFGPLSREEFKTLVDLTERLIESGDKAVALQTYLLSQMDES
jgi:DNA-binding MarR family transcriptional regulator